MRSPFAYSPGSSPLHRANAAATIAFLSSFALVAFVFDNPLVLAAAGVAVFLAGRLAGAERALLAALRWGALLFVLMVVVNGLVTHRGLTVLIRGYELPVLGQTDITLESLAAGGVIGMRIVVVMLAFAVYSACVDPDAVLRLLRPVARRSALTAMLVTRMVPTTASDSARLNEAAELRGPGAAPVGRAAMARRLLAGSLDRAVDLAATIELRGYGLAGGSEPRRRRSRHDARLYVCGAAVAALAVAARIAGVAGFETYPRIELAVGPAAIALLVALPALAAIPFAPRRLSRGAGDG